MEIIKQLIETMSKKTLFIVAFVLGALAMALLLHFTTKQTASDGTRTYEEGYSDGYAQGFDEGFYAAEDDLAE